MPSGSVEALLSQVAAFSPRTAGETFTLAVPDSLTLRGATIPHDVAMAVIVDALLAKALYPSGFTLGHGMRTYQYRYEG
jgi:hypothetical protein